MVQSPRPLKLLPAGPFADRLAVDSQLPCDDGFSETGCSPCCDQGSTRGRSSGQLVNVHPRFLPGWLVVWRLPTHPAERGCVTTFRGRRPGRSHRGQPGEAALLRVLVHPLVEGAEGLRAAAQEDGAKSVEIAPEVVERRHRIRGESRVLTLRRDSLERANASNEILVRERFLAEVVPDQAQP